LFFVTAEPIRDKKTIQKMAGYWLAHKHYRNFLLIVLGVSTALRISDLLSLVWADVYDFSRRRYKTHLAIKEKKTGKERLIALSPAAVRALKLYFAASSPTGEAHLFPGRGGLPLSRSQAWRIVKWTARAVGAAGQVSPHSLRKTLGYHAAHAKASPALLMALYNHTSYTVTRRYLGLTQEELDRVYLGTRFFGKEALFVCHA
jgi:integrase